MSEIKEANIEFKRQLSVKWIKAASGHTYLCPVDALKRFRQSHRGAAQDHLRRRV